MSRFLLDTGIAGDCVFRRHGVDRRVREEMAAGRRVGIAMPVLAELAYGAEHGADPERNVALVTARIRTLRLWPFDRDAAFEYGRIAAEQRRIGRPMQSMDMMIAAVAFVMDCTVVSKDSDLAAVPGLRVEDWSA